MSNLSDPESLAREILGEALNLPPGELGARSTQESIEGWNSLAHLNLVLRLEDVLGCQLTTDEIVSMQSLQDIVDLIGTRRN